MKNLGYPKDAVKLVGNIYSQSNTIFTSVRSSTTKTLFLIKKTRGAYRCSQIDNFPLKATPFEQIWCQLVEIQIPQFSPTQTFKFIHKLLLQNIYEINHITSLNGKNLMSQEDFKHYYVTPTKLIKQALDIPKCNPTCLNPCTNHHPPRTLKEEYITMDHNVESRTREIPTHPPTPPHPPQPKPSLNIKNNPIRYPIHSILNYKEIKTKNKHKITKKYQTFLCQ